MCASVSFLIRRREIKRTLLMDVGHQGRDEAARSSNLIAFAREEITSNRIRSSTRECRREESVPLNNYLNK